MTKPKDLILPNVGAFRILEKDKSTHVFSHIAAWLTHKNADELERVGLWLIEAAAYVRDKQSNSHRDQ
jgi:hypothetical protein